jgi:fructokinase
MFAGVDLGGTKTEIICLDAVSGAEIFRHRKASPRDDYQATLASITSLVHHAQDECGLRISSLGVGIPGTICSATGNVKNANSTWLNGHPLAQDLTDMLSLPVAVDNDANCFAVSEAADGAAAGKGVVFGVIIGTGCGAGLAYSGKAHIGMNGIGGEWGHNPLPWPRQYSADADALNSQAIKAREAIISPIYDHKPYIAQYVSTLDDNEYLGAACYCGKFGCLETWISGTGFENDYQRRSGQRLKGADIVARAEAGESAAEQSLAAYIDRLARGLASVVDVIDPDAIVLGGGMGNIARLYDELPEKLALYCFSNTLNVNIVPPKHGDSSGVRGAAWLGRNQ